ncbi:hypothetical protein AJ88_20985 [Mesorhizobium amorphae CCBAU 01583]|nr:hypothetical protein AJ88_20985 [Mesorhizobium amorphae CCBAU 01583]
MAVCNNDGLLVLDKEIRDLVDRLNELAAPDPTAQQRIADRWSKWQKALDDGCRSSVKCLIRSYRSGVTNLKQEARRLQRKPAAVQNQILTIKAENWCALVQLTDGHILPETAEEP